MGGGWVGLALGEFGRGLVGFWWEGWRRRRELTWEEILADAFVVCCEGK